MAQSAVLHPATESAIDNQRVLLVWPAASSSTDEIFHALIYLPDRYKLMVCTNEAARAHISEVASKNGMIDRIEFSDTGLSDAASPFSYADVVVYGSAHEHVYTTSAPTVTITDGLASSIEHTGRNYAVAAGNPEALASAVLRVARAAV